VRKAIEQSAAALFLPLERAIGFAELPPPRKLARPICGDAESRGSRCLSTGASCGLRVPIPVRSKIRQQQLVRWERKSRCWARGGHF